MSTLHQYHYNLSKEFNGENVCHVTFDLQDSSRKLPTFNDKGMNLRTILIAT